MRDPSRVRVITLDNPPVNALSFAYCANLYEAIEAAHADDSVEAIVFAGANGLFSGGADVNDFSTPPDGKKTIRDVIETVERSDKTFVAAIDGNALGGGFELALACDYRVATSKSRVGLPEIKLGLLPGAGGTQRLPRLIGANDALQMMLKGDMVKAPDAQKKGILDAVVEADAVSAAKAFAGKPKRRLSQIKAELGVANLGLFATPFVVAQAHMMVPPEDNGGYAAHKLIDAVQAAIELPFERGWARELRLFMELVQSKPSAALRHVFFAERELGKVPGLPPAAPLPCASAGVVGAGTMGGGIAMNFANAGIPVTIVEMQQEALDRGLSVIRKNYENTAKRGRLTMDDVEKRTGLIKGSLKLEDLADCDLTIEAVYENMDVKKDIFRKLDGIVKQGAILATNTSALNIDEIASVTKRPEAVIGLHFFSPANVMRLLEVVRADKTSSAVIATSMQIAKKIGKIAALVGVCPGFVGNRILAQRQREAQKLMFEGAMPWDIDRVLYDFGFPMGPFAMSDLAGLDIGWIKEKSKGETIRDVLCEMDRRGQKTGAGYYDYDENRNAKPSPVTEKIIKDFVTKSGVNPRQISDEEILERTIYPMINEGAKILEEGKAIRASDIDIVWINGYGWPVYRGGPMFYGDTIGLDKVLAKMKLWQAQMGDAYKPSALLERLVAEGKRFQDLKQGE